MNKENLLIAASTGLVLQLIMVVARHYMPPVKDKFAVGGMLISLVAGALYLRLAQQDWPGALIGGALAGGICALIAIAVSVGLKDVPPIILVIGTGASVATGLIGGAIAKLV